MIPKTPKRESVFPLTHSGINNLNTIAMNATADKSYIAIVI